MRPSRSLDVKKRHVDSYSTVCLRETEPASLCTNYLVAILLRRLVLWGRSTVKIAKNSAGWQALLNIFMRPLIESSEGLGSERMRSLHLHRITQRWLSSSLPLSENLWPRLHCIRRRDLEWLVFDEETLETCKKSVSLSFIEIQQRYWYIK